MSNGPKDDLLSCLTSDLHRVPTVEYALLERQLPMSPKDMEVIDEMINHPERFELKPWFDGRGVPWCSSACPRWDRKHELCVHSDDDGEDDGDVCTPMVHQMSRNGAAIHRRCQAAESKLRSSRRQHRTVLRLLREIIEPTCVVCDCLLAEPPMNLCDTDPPHCIDCVLELEHFERWENETRPMMRGRIKAAMSLEPPADD